MYPDRSVTYVPGLYLAPPNHRMKLSGRGHRFSRGQQHPSTAGSALPTEPRPCSSCGVVSQHPQTDRL
jgi:hypothetical protein